MHRKTLDPYDRPWASTPTKITKTQPSEEKQTKPAKGSEFMVPIRGFFCLLCKEFYGDAICAEEHVTVHAHNEKYKKQMYENPLYEQRRNLDRQAGLALEASGKKRKHDDDDKGKDKEDKSKHKKDKKDKKKEDEQDSHKDEKSKVKNEEETKPSKKEEEVKKPKKQEDEYEDKLKHNKDDKHRYSREEDEREKYRKDEEDRYKYSREEEYRYRNRSFDDDRYSNRSKYGPRGDEDKYKNDKYSDSRSKLGSKPDKDGFKKSEAAKPTEKPQVSKQSEPPPKPHDPPKILCGPSPAMRAKLRKQNQEAGKLSPAATATVASFGKFTWKKKENQLAKEAQKVAAEFMKEDEASANKTPPPVEDCFAKSVAVAKEIAQKLSAQPSTVRPWASNGANKWKIRPNLPAPAATTLRKTAIMGKPAPLNTFLSIRPQTQNTAQSVLESPQKDDSRTLHPSVNDPIFPNVQTDTFIVPDLPKNKVPKTPTSAANTQTQPVTTTPVIPLPTGPTPARVSAPAPPVSTPVINIAPPVTKSVPMAPTPAPSAKPQQSTMIKVVSDVAAPGVPENEQTRTVFVKPPPFMNVGDGGSKPEKTLKSNMAAAKAQDLFGIFYSSISQSGPSSMLKPAIDTRTYVNTTSKGPVAPQQTPKLQPEPQNPPKVQATPQPQSNKSELQTHLESNQSEPRTHLESNKLEPQTHPESKKSEPQTHPESKKSEPQTHPESKKSEPPTHPESRKSEPQTRPESKKSEPQTHPESNQSQSHSQLESELQITSVWSLNESEASPSKSTSQTDPTQTKQSSSQNQTGLPELDQAPQTKPEPQREPQPDLDSKRLTETSPDLPSEPEPKPGPKTRGKTTPTKKKTALTTTRPVRQTRYQTRRQQQQQQPSPEPEQASGESSEPNDLEESNPGTGSGSQLVEGDVQVIDVTPETLGLPSDMTALNFDYDFNFE